jgi:hypothetical protein
MMMAAPVESRARVRRMWSFSRDLRDGKPIDIEAATLLAQGLEALCDAEDRAAPTAVDAKMPKKLAAVHDALHDALHTQMGDPDNGTDPVDAEVFGHLKDMAASLVKATIAQGTDGAPDNGADDAGNAGASSKAGDDGTQNGPGDAPTDAQDGTGSRSKLALELELLAIERRRRETAAA